jgi:ABC-type transporter MlaC component
MLKKFLALSMLLGSIAFFGSSAEAKSANSSTLVTANSPQINIRLGNRNRNRRNNQRTVRTIVKTVRRGGSVYRETYRVVTNRNGRTTTTLVSRSRVR